MLGRRSFLIGCGGLAMAPAFASLNLPLTAAHSALWQAVDTLAPSGTATLITPQDFVLRIEGWDTDADSRAAADGEVWIHINSSWQATWR